MDQIINKIFDNLDKWRHYPSYQLERRADIFFSVYLAGFLKCEYGKDIIKIIPEFPVAIRTIHPGTAHFKSKKIDYLAKTVNNNCVYFIELKTDNKSHNEDQDNYLEFAKEVNIPELLRGLKEIFNKTDYKNNIHLFNDLVTCGFS